MSKGVRRGRKWEEEDGEVLRYLNLPSTAKAISMNVSILNGGLTSHMLQECYKLLSINKL